MNSNIEKYINYIVDDLVSNTRLTLHSRSSEVEDYQHFILPFITSPVPNHYVCNTKFSYSYPFFRYFRDYVIGYYGLREDEIETIWNKYRMILSDIGEY